MNLLLNFRRLIIVLGILLLTQHIEAQFLMDMVDTTKDMGKGMLQLYNKFNRIKISGYTQFQFQVAQDKGIKSYAGGNFDPKVNSRFMIRRGRIRFDYIRQNTKQQPVLQLAMQLDGTERGFAIRDFWGRLFENKWQVFSFTTGMFARPFGYEVNLGSADRESPERGRMSQILMRGERDLGAMVSFEPRSKTHPLRFLKADIGFFNGQGVTTTADYDSYKDIIGRVSLKPYPLTKKLFISSGVSFFNGGFVENNKYLYKTIQINGTKRVSVDSSINNLNSKVPRNYYGIDLQLKMKHNKVSSTELRAEYWLGKQTATASISETPTTLLTEPYYLRKFNGAFFYLIHTINARHQVLVKYDWYDPNTDFKGTSINTVNGGTVADVKFSTLGFGYNYYANENLRLLLWYDAVNNEKTSLSGYTSDVKDNVFTCRLQFRF
jgi:hypothetical protein